MGIWVVYHTWPLNMGYMPFHLGAGVLEGTALTRASRDHRGVQLPQLQVLPDCLHHRFLLPYAPTNHLSVVLSIRGVLKLTDFCQSSE